MKTITQSGLLLALFLFGAEASIAQNNYFAGPQAGLSNTTGTDDTFIGAGAGLKNTSGYRNSFLGSLAGYNTTSGAFNSFLGNYAGFYNITGSYNAFFGYGAGTFNTANYNSYFGASAGYNANSSTGNSFFGYAAGYGNTTGSYNSFFGYGSGYYTGTGTNNAFFGYASGNLNTSGSGNSFVGYYAGANNGGGSGNSFFGDQSGRLNSSGYYNSLVGGYAGYNNSSGTGNCFVGYSTGYANTSGGYNSSYGYAAGGRNTSGGYNTSMGYFAGPDNTTGGNNTYVGNQAGQYNTTGSSNSYFGYLARPSSMHPTLTNATAIGSRAMISKSNAIVLGCINGRNGATVNAQVGIGTEAPAYQLQLSTNSAAKPGSSSWTIASDQRLKQNVTEFSDGLDVLEKIRPVRFRYNGKAGMPTDKEYVGIIAQEMQKVAPYMIGEFDYQDSTGQSESYLDYDASALSYVLVNAVKELKNENTMLKNELAEIKALLKQGNLPVSDNTATLWQNVPNPTDGTTRIRYRIPQDAASAQLKVFAINGQEVKSIDIVGQGEGEVELSNEQLSSGLYVYHLFVDGQSVASKKLILKR